MLGVSHQLTFSQETFGTYRGLLVCHMRIWPNPVQCTPWQLLQALARHAQAG